MFLLRAVLGACYLICHVWSIKLKAEDRFEDQEIHG